MGQLIVRAGLGQTPVFQDEDDIGPAEQTEPAGNDEGRPAGHGGAQGSEDFVLGLGVNGGGRIVQDEDGRLQQQGAGQGQALALAAGKVHAGFTQDGGVALREGE